MPGKIRIIFEADNPVPVSELSPDRIHGLFFSILDSETAGKLHSINGLKPFTLCCPVFFRSKKETVKRFFVEITFLEDWLLSKTTTAVILNSRNRNYYLNSYKIKLFRTFKIDSDDIISYENIKEKANTRTRDIILDFITPTTFKRGKYDYPLPEPSLIYKSILKKWNRFSGERLPSKEILEKIGRDIQVAGCWIKTTKLEMASLKKITGFRGRIVFYNASKDAEFNRIITQLTLFAPFCGIGRKTTMGFGKVRTFFNLQGG
ncbi:CRISPR-associated endoribonuclease Cas6 [Desulfurobacterium sp. TC5-1]|uniref:CRISPR-associated endoribonuclease Cas6 n=1 Tax=Desulfurobacterium sp. TC5-1 TaxID=1158318 RepID=UPI0003B6374C|nr:CRISPR-associated endoribonuclease Cas6 [Desulfurobacterium sp. TC5-1]